MCAQTIREVINILAEHRDRDFNFYGWSSFKCFLFASIHYFFQNKKIRSLFKKPYLGRILIERKISSGLVVGIKYC